MSEKDLEALVTEILANTPPIADSGQYGKIGGQMPVSRRQNFSVRPRKRRPSRNPLYASLRLIILGLVLLLVPLLFAVKKTHPPGSMITGAIAPTQTTIRPIDVLTTSNALIIAPQTVG